MNRGTNAYSSPKAAISSKDKLRGTSSHAIHSETDTKPVLNKISSPTRTYSSSLSKFSSENHSRQPAAVASTFNSPKISASYISQFNSSTLLNKESSQTVGNAENRFFKAENKKHIIASRYQSDSSKRASLGKFNARTRSNTAISQKIDFGVIAQKDNQLVKVEFSGASKDNRIMIESPKNLYQRKEQSVGSCGPTPTNSESKKGSLRTAVSASGKKYQDFDFQDSVFSNGMTASFGRKQALAHQENLFPGKENSNNSITNYYMIQKMENAADLQISHAKTANTASFLTPKQDVLFNNLFSPKKKLNDIPLSKGHPRSLNEHNSLNLNYLDNSAHLKNKVPILTQGAKPLQNATNNLDENLLQLSNNIHTNYSTGISHSSQINQRFSSQKGQPENPGALSFFSSLHKQKRYNYQEYLRDKREEFENPDRNQSAVNQNLKSSTTNINLIENSERSVNSQISDFSKIKLSNSRKQLEDTCNKFASGNVRGEDAACKTQVKQYTNNTDKSSRAELQQFTDSSEIPSKNALRSHNYRHTIQDILEIEKKKTETLKHRFSKNLDTNKFNKDKSGLTDALTSIQVVDNNLFVSEPIEMKRYPKSAKNSVSSLCFEVEPNSGFSQREMSADNFTSITKQPRSIDDSLARMHNKCILKSENRDYYPFGGCHSIPLKPECLTGSIQPEKIKKHEFVTPSSNDFIEFEEISINDIEKHFNSYEKKHTFKSESDRDQQLTERRYNSYHNFESLEPQIEVMINKQNREKHKLSQNTATGTSEQLHVLAIRMKKILEDNQNRELMWKNEKSHMKKRIDELERRLSKYEN